MAVQDVLNAIIRKNGNAYQMTICIEELAELTKELTKAIRSKGSNMHICEEIADVEICLAQLRLMIPKANDHINLFKQFKLRRLQKLYIEGNEQ